MSKKKELKEMNFTIDIVAILVMMIIFAVAMAWDEVDQATGIWKECSQRLGSARIIGN